MDKDIATIEQDIFIDPKTIPSSVLETACRVLNSSIRLALADPVKRADFEAWKAKRVVG